MYETALNKIGFVWDGAAEKLQREIALWDTSFQKLKEYKERNGHWPPPKPGLGYFLQNNRKYLRQWNRGDGSRTKGQEYLAKGRYERMQSIGAL